MAQNIDLLGAQYPSVPSVLLPKVGGGTASFTDVTDTTATAADVAEGKTFHLASGAAAVGTASGGGGGVETASVVVCKASGGGYGRVYYTDENMEPQNAYGIVRASMPIGSIVVADDSTPAADPELTAQRAGITQLFAYPSRRSVINAFKVTG